MYRSMILNPRYGVLGLVVLPYIIVFEALAPLVQVGGLPIVTLAFLMQVTGWEQYRALLMASLLFGTATGLVAVALNDLSTGRYLSPREFLVLMGAALLEGIGYRQINSWWSCVGTWEVLSGKKGWGTLTRKAFEA